MKYDIIGKNGFQPTQAIKDYAIKRLEKIVALFDKGVITEARVVCKVYPETQRVEVTIPAPQITLRAETSDPDLYAAIDKTVDKLDRQIKKFRSRLSSHFEKVGVNKAFSAEFDAEALEKELISTKLVKEKKIKIAPMTVDEAISQMELVGHDFFIFINKETGQPQVVYRREEGDYAVINTTV